MATDSEHLREHDADNFHSLRHLDARHLLYRHYIRQVVHHTAKIIDSIGVRYISVPGLSLAHLLRTTMVITNVWHRIHENLTIQLQGNAKRTVNTGVIRA